MKAYLVSKGIEKNRVYTEGRAKSNPWLTTRSKPKAAPRTVAWKSKWSALVLPSNL